MMEDRDLDLFADYFLRTMNALTALQMARAAISLEPARETPHTETDQPGLQMGKHGNNETESGR
jgi:hypothetical protein